LVVVSSAQYLGFNLVWGNVFTNPVTMKYLSNCAVDDRDEEGRPKVLTLDGGVYGLANDLLDDEFVKVTSPSTSTLRITYSVGLIIYSSRAHT